MSTSRFFHLKSGIGFPGPIDLTVWREGGQIPLNCKGGGPNWHVFEFSEEKEIIRKKEKIIAPLPINPTDSQPVNLLIRAADLVRAKGQVRPISGAPVIEETVGIIYNQVRRRKKISLERLARTTGFAIEEIVAFEAGLLPRLRMCEMLPNLAREVGMDFARLFPQFRLPQK